MPNRTATLQEADLCAAQGLLASILATRWNGRSVDAEAAARVPAAAFRSALMLHGLAGVLERRHRRELEQLPAELLAAVKVVRKRVLMQAMSCMAAQQRVLQALGRAGIDCLPLKGLTLSWTLYGDPFVRPGGDIDLLVDPARVHEAVAAIRALGFEPASPLPARPLHWRELMRSAHHVNFNDRGGAYLELHWRNDPLVCTSLPPLSEMLPLLGHIDSGPLAGTLALPPALLLRSLATHAGRSRCTRWKWGYDVIETLSAQSGDGDPWQPETFSRQDRAVRFVLAMMAVELGLPGAVGLRVPPGIATMRRAAAIERRQIVGGGVGAERTVLQGATLHAAACVAQPSLRAALEYLWWMATRVPASLGDTAYSIVAIAPVLAPAARIASSLAGKLRGFRRPPNV